GVLTGCLPQLPAVPVEKGYRRPREHADMPPSLFRGLAAKVDDPHGWNIRNAGDSTGTQAKVEVLEIQEILRREPLQLLQHRSPEQHEATTDDRNIPDHLIADHIPHLIAVQPFPKRASHSRRHETAQNQIRDRWVALA